MVFAARPAVAVDGVSIEAGNGSFIASDLYRLSLMWDWPALVTLGDSIVLTGYWDAGIGWWRRQDDQLGPAKGTADLGFTPVFRLQTAAPVIGNAVPFLEGAVGLHLLSRPSAFGRRISTAFEFGDHVGAGLRFTGGYEISYRLQHYSNAGIAKPNGGMNFHILRLAVLF